MAAVASGPISVPAVERIAHPQRADRRGERRRETIVDRVGHDEALGGDAGLAGVDHARLDRGGDRAVEISARQHHERVAAAQLEDGLLQVRARGGPDGAPGRLAAGHRHRGDAIVGDERRHRARSR